MLVVLEFSHIRLGMLKSLPNSPVLQNQGALIFGCSQFMFTLRWRLQDQSMINTSCIASVTLPSRSEASADARRAGACDAAVAMRRRGAAALRRAHQVESEIKIKNKV